MTRGPGVCVEMVADIRNLSVMHYANGVTLWSYKGTDVPLGVLLRSLNEEPPAWFFDMFKDGDFVTISASDGGAMRYVLNRNLEVLR